MRSPKAFLRQHREVISYLFWGGMTTLVSWGTYSLFVVVMNSFAAANPVAVANVISWICAVLFAFLANKLFVFRSEARSLYAVLRELWKFIVARIATGILEIIGVPFLVGIGLDRQVFGIDGMASKVLVSVAVVMLNYVLSKLFIFGNRNSPRENQ